MRGSCVPERHSIGLHHRTSAKKGNWKRKNTGRGVFSLTAFAGGNPGASQGLQILLLDAESLILRGICRGTLSTFAP